MSALRDEPDRTAAPEPPTTDPDRRPGVPEVLAALLLVTGAAALRVHVFLDARSLWIDEAMLAVNLVERGFAGLLKPLAFDQAAPLGFLFLERGAVLAPGPGELALRAVPLAASLLALPLLWLLARRAAGRVGALAALAVFALLPSLVYYAAEVKQYGLDVLVALLLLVACARGLQDGWTRGRSVRLGLLGALAVWFSHPAAFVLGGCGLVVGFDALRGRRWRELAGWLAVGLAWVGSFALRFALFDRRLLQNDYLAHYWSAGAAFLPLPPRSGEDLRVGLELLHGLLAGAFRSSLSAPFASGERTALVAAVALLAGLRLVARRDRRLLALLLLPVVLAAGASALHLYPFQGRLLLFVAPVLAVLAGAGVAAVRARGGRLLAGALLAALLAWPAVGAADLLTHPSAREELRPLLAALAERAEPGDAVYVSYGAVPAWHYYVEDRHLLPVDDLRIVLGGEHRDDPAAYADELREHVGPGRTWVLVSHVHVGERGDERALLLADLDRHGTREQTVSAPGAWLDLYRIERPLAVATPR